MRQRRVGVKKFSTFQCFTQPAIFAYFEFPILSNPEQTTITPLYWGTFLDKNHHKCNINTRNTHMNTIFANYLNLYVIKLKYRYLKVLHKTLQNFQNELSINHHDLTLFGTKLRKKPSRGNGKYRCLEKGALEIFRNYIQDPVKPLRWSSLLKQLTAENF